MRVRAKHWVSYGGRFYRAGEEFEITLGDAKDVLQHCEIVNTLESAETPVSESASSMGGAAELPEPVRRRGRPRKTEQGEAVSF